MNLLHNKQSVRCLNIGRFFIGLLCLGFMAGCNSSQKSIHLEGEAQGTYYSIIYYDSLQRDFSGAVDSILDAFDQTVSLWVDSSLIRRLNDNRTTHLNDMMADMLAKSIAINQYTDGAFDCRVGKIVQAWGFSFKQRSSLTDEEIDTLLHTARGAIAIDTHSDGTIHLNKALSSTEIDLNAIAQGYSVDLVAQYFEEHDVHSYLIDIGGEVIARGTKPNGEPWHVGIERPSENQYSEREVETAIALEDLSVVTSGSYRKYYEKSGVKYSHTIDPATGRPVQHTLLSASVIDTFAWRADALATAFMVMGLEKSLAFIANHPNDPQVQAVYFIYDDNGTYQTYATPEFEKHIIQ